MPRSRHSRGARRLEVEPSLLVGRSTVTDSTHHASLVWDSPTAISCAGMSFTPSASAVSKK